MSAEARIARALLARLGAAAGEPLQVVDAGSRPWASITFCGFRHHFVLRQSAAAAERLAAAAPELECPLPGHLLADLAVAKAGDDGRLTVEALSVEAS
jgi:hypothetical protein